MANAKLDKINNRINAVAAAERITKAELSALSRELLDYVVVDGTWDIDAVNRCINVLTPMNKQTAVLYFKEFLPYSFDEDSLRFTKKNKKADKKIAAITEWLAGAANDIWLWALNNLDLKKKPVNHMQRIQKDIEKALADDEAGLTVTDIFNAILSADGITLTDLLIEAERAQEAQDKAAEA